MTRGTLVIGLGNRYRGDDAAGLCVAACLRALALPDVDVVEHEGEPLELLDRWFDANLVVIIDATVSAAPPGAVHRFDARLGPLPSQSFRYSTHALSLAEVIELARATHSLPSTLIIYGITGAYFGAGAGLSSPVQQAIDAAVERVRQEIAARPEPDIAREQAPDA